MTTGWACTRRYGICLQPPSEPGRHALHTGISTFGIPSVLLRVQFQQKQRKSSSLNDELKAAKEQNVLVVGQNSFCPCGYVISKHQVQDCVFVELILFTHAAKAS